MSGIIWKKVEPSLTAHLQHNSKGDATYYPDAQMLTIETVDIATTTSQYIRFDNVTVEEASFIISHFTLIHVTEHFGRK